MFREIGIRRFALVALFAALFVVAPLAAAPQVSEQQLSQVPGPVSDPETGEEVIVIDPNWRGLYPFSARFPNLKSQNRAQVIDLAAIRFATDGLVATKSGGGREFDAPDMSSFATHGERAPFEQADSDLFIVQAPAPAAQVELRASLEALGAEILGYVPHTAYLVRLTSGQHAELTERPEVFWMGLYQPAWRVAPKLDYIAQARSNQPLRMTVLLSPEDFPSQGALRSALRGLGVQVQRVVRREFDWKARIQGEAADADQLAGVRGVLWVERFVDYELHNNVARTSANTTTGRGGASGPIMDVEDVWSRGIRGEGQIVAAADTGLSTGSLSSLHLDFGDQSSSTNPMRVIKGYALGRGTWNDDVSQGGGHGTHVSGSIVGNGFRSGSNPSTNSFPASSYAGTAPKAQFVFQSIMDSGGNLGGIPTNLNNLFQPPYDDGARVHSNSWGAPVDGVYNTDAQELDQFTWLNQDMLISFSAGNSGRDGRRVVSGSCTNTGDPIDGVIDNDSVGAPGTAKNSLTVGASENYRPDFVYEFPQNDCTSSNGVEQKTWGWFSSCSFSTNPIFGDLMADNASGLGAFSSHGPTDDGRVKPDIVAPGIAIISTRSDQNQAYEQWGICNIPASLRTYYLTQGGTSMSNPLTAGAATLVRQYYVDGWHANGSRVTHSSPVSADGFNPTAALVKATLLNGAYSMSPGQFGTGSTQEIASDLPNTAEGYGRVDLEGALFPGSGFGDDASRVMEVHDISSGLSTGQSTDYAISVASSADPLIVTLVWTDPFAGTGSGTKLVNDLDVTVIAPNATTYYANGIDKTSGLDRTNNVEQVTVSSPATGNWTVRVNGFNVPGNAVSGTNSQPYALVISGVLGDPPGGGGNGPQNAVYDSGLGAPKCAVTGSSCNSQSLLDGRGTVGPEPNQPNTLGSCTDGTSGSYHSDESADKIVVSTLDGSDFTEGATVKVDVTVWAYQSGADDDLEIYYAADANSPSWTLVGSFKPGGGNAQTISANYTLPTGSLQAVRAVFRYSNTQTTCPTGNWDDVDDLVFAVGSGGGGTNTAPSVTISSPADNSSSTAGASVSFAGSANDTEDGDLSSSLAWTSSLDGSIGSGASFSTSSLSTGTHTITASVTDSGSLTGSDSITLTVNPGAVAQNATFDATLQVPKCAVVGISCDSGTLLQGRGTKGPSGGPEPNQPNTINDSCADGTSGTYHSDESNDAIKVSTNDGTAFAPGKTVTIEATVWAWSTGSQDTLDLYYAADANSPSWTFIASLSPPAGGAQTLSTTYTLPSGTLQAVRARFRYQGSASSCSTGNYDDHDDLVFAVNP